MKYDIVGSFLPPYDQLDLTTDQAVDLIVERQLRTGLGAVTSGELRRNTWDHDFFSQLGGIALERIDSGRLYQHVETFTDLLRIDGAIHYNPSHPMFGDFEHLHAVVAGRAVCRQTLPSPADLFLALWEINRDAPAGLAQEIAEAYRMSLLHFYELGCRDILIDDTAIVRLSDKNYTDSLLRGGIDSTELQHKVIDIINSTLTGLPADMKKSIYLSGGPVIIPDWHQASEPGNILPQALARLNVDTFFLPFEPGNTADLEVLRHVPADCSVVLGLPDAHTPYDEHEADIRTSIEAASAIIPAKRLALSHRSGFKIGSHAERGLTFEDQWRKLDELRAFCSTIN